MRRTPIIAGIAAGAVLAAGGLSAIDLATTSADAQGGGPVTQAQFKRLEAKVTGVGQNSSAAQRISKNLNNFLGKHVVPEGTLVGAKEPPGVIRQDRGVGGGLPEEVLSEQVRAKLNAAGPGGPPGSPGAVGPQGQQGEQGAPGIAGYQIVGDVSDENSNLEKSAEAFCPDGKKVLGGGADILGPSDVALTSSRPVVASDSYAARGIEVNGTAQDWFISVWAICGFVEP